MRRIRIAYDSARRGRTALSIAVIAALCGALVPVAAAADTTPTPAPTPAATAEPSPTPTVAPTPRPTVDATVPSATIAPTPTPTSQPSADPTPEPTVTAGPAPKETEEPSIPTPENGDYIGSNTEDEADPGAYSAAMGDEMRAMSLSGFRPGNIISNANLYTSGTMSAAKIQNFFDQRVPKCDSGYTCLKDFRMNTISKSPNSYCGGSYSGARNESAARIISKVSKACKVSEKALIVMLQKEQGLVTHTWPSDFRYDIAMGYACPDDAACDTTYFGFQNQMYMAAYQLQRYTKDSYFSWYPVGKTSPVRYHPNASCGSSGVHIENKATAALYYYTPYQPNRAALNAGYGVGDSCSAYGNRNFYNYYTDWFGPTRGSAGPDYPVTGAIGTKWRALGGIKGTLGQPTARQVCGLARHDGCYQRFEGGAIHWSSKTGAHYTSGAIKSRWNSLSSQNGRLGYPTSDPRCGLEQGGCAQRFEKGRVHWTSGTGAHSTTNSILQKWRASGWQAGELGYPTKERWCNASSTVCTQQFQYGKVHWLKGHGTYMTTRTIHDRWNATGKGSGSLRQPTSDRRCGLEDGGCAQRFQGGRIHWTSGTGAHSTSGVFMKTWRAHGWQAGHLGYPTSEKRCGLENGGCAQRFQGGRIHWSPKTGAHPTTGSFMQTWRGQGWQAGKLGYPTSDKRCGLERGGCAQRFQGGRIHSSPATGTHATSGAIMQAWRARGWQTGRLGYPTGDGNCSSSGNACVQWFQGGSIRWERGIGTTVRYW
ncbi:hypothetical protein [Microbacterium sp. G2-8]|uniref:hypothetical protein n=1 Tax=Microbacterium sp. G2-8 TaxID=2842454 RepID=UPI001C89AD93|nr:hypothetical protein [Microbacterium sp. G2-8]